MTSNRLSSETSPYLLQHRDNPVHWWAWGPEALAEAKATGKPILLSVGYAACHWCHVMAHESFEDEATAAVMNMLFVNIKVDREERPDIDAIYMSALHALGEQGGWPLTMFLDGDARPFFGGTYFPKDERYGRPSFVSVLKQIALVYSNDRKTVDHNALALTSAIQERPQAGQFFKVSDAALEGLVHRLTGAIDMEHGGLKGAPKFPQWSIFWLLWRGAMRYGDDSAKRAVITTLSNICQGGIYDHLGGGFSRYSVDERWLVPHFEKMLYDNALLLDLMREVHIETGDPLFKVRIAETIAWLEREMTTAEGGFASSLDADSEGEEGKFYVWTAGEIEEVLGAEDGAYFCKAYDVTPDGNWDGDHHSPSPVPTAILNRLGGIALLPPEEEDRLASLRAKLLARRASRVRPGFDDKVLADWNGLMIASLAKAGIAFSRADWIAKAEHAFGFISSRMAQGGRLRHSYRAGKLTAPATAADYANMITAALALHQATLAPRYLQAAVEWLAVLDTHYWVDGRGYATSADDTTDVIVRLVSAHDDAMPNANAMMLTNLMHLFLLTGETAHVERADALVGAFAGDIAGSVVGHAGFLAQALDIVAPSLVVLAEGDGIHALWDAARVSIPGALVYRTADGACDLPVGLAGKVSIDGKAAAYLCLGPQCSAPITDPAVLRPQMLALRNAQSNHFSTRNMS